MDDRTRTVSGSVNIAILTVSDTRNAGSDTSGQILADKAARDGHSVVAREIVRDDEHSIRLQLQDWIADRKIDAILTTGGTGLTGRDVTIEAHESLYEKHIPAFGVIFALVSHGKIGSSAVQSRACAGVADGTYLFALPGSPGACADAWDEILTHQFNINHRPCNFLEIMPRLQE